MAKITQLINSTCYIAETYFSLIIAHYKEKKTTHFNAMLDSFI